MTNERNKNGHLLYIGKCIHCGTRLKQRIMEFKRSTTTKCRHYNNFGIKHISWKSKRLCNTFSGMQIRCYDKNNKSYRFYGAKGIKICDEWMQNPSLFQNWAYENGYDEDLTIDRKESDKDYSPDNCRWVTSLDNSRYKKTTRLITVNGYEKTGREWASYLDVGTNKINKYYRKYGEKYTKQYIASELEKMHLHSA